MNELISIKSELNILQDREGRRLKEYQIEVVNDELIITDDGGDFFEYNPLNKESQRVQETLFHEKQAIIENCLFGVDINPNSVKICRLRLWIELLKNSYYKNAVELETLPNIDINIKCGNSLISRFELDADLSQALAKSKWSIDRYRRSVQIYRNAKTKDQKREMELLIDFGDAPVFDATAYPSIIVMQQSSDKKALAANTLEALNWTAGESVSAFADIFRERAFSMRQSYLTPAGWQLEKPVIFELMEKMRGAGQPLGEYVKGEIYYGIKTGFNEAFVIDQATRERLIAEDPNCGEIIKPFLRGRDVKRWSVNYANQHLIKIESSENKNHPWSGLSKDEAEQIFAKTYPSVYGWMIPHRENLLKRCDQGNYFWELRSCVYYEEFQTSKILYQEISTFHAFAWDEDNYFANNKCFLIPNATKFLLGLLNAPTSWWFLGNLVTKLNGGAYAMQAPYVTQIQIPAASAAEQSAIEQRVEKILALKGSNPTADVSELEAEINQIVYQLYDLTPAEIAIVEGV